MRLSLFVISISFWYLWKWLSYNRQAKIVIPAAYVHVAWKVRRGFMWAALLTVLALALNKYRGLLQVLRYAPGQLLLSS